MCVCVCVCVCARISLRSNTSIFKRKCISEAKTQTNTADGCKNILVIPLRCMFHVSCAANTDVWFASPG